VLNARFQAEGFNWCADSLRRGRAKEASLLTSGQQTLMIGERIRQRFESVRVLGPDSRLYRVFKAVFQVQ
jgi:hypothetical protein